MASEGPKIQLPPAASPLVTNNVLNTAWGQYLHSVQQIAFLVSRSGPTASRPTSAVDGRYVGMPYFDTTLGYPVFLKSVNPDVWVYGGGTVR